MNSESYEIRRESRTIWSGDGEREIVEYQVWRLGRRPGFRAYIVFGFGVLLTVVAAIFSAFPLYIISFILLCAGVVIFFDEFTHHCIRSFDEGATAKAYVKFIKKYGEEDYG